MRIMTKACWMWTRISRSLVLILVLNRDMEMRKPINRTPYKILYFFAFTMS